MLNLLYKLDNCILMYTHNDVKGIKAVNDQHSALCRIYILLQNILNYIINPHTYISV